MGMSEVLRSIKTAEQDAEKRLSDAQEEASKILSDARRQSTELVQKAADETVAMTDVKCACAVWGRSLHARAA